MHYPADVVRPPLDQQENVICHKAICIQVKRKPLLLRPKQRDELPVVLLTMKNIPPVNATSNNVIKTTLDLKSWFPGHTFPLSISSKYVMMQRRIARIAGLTPIFLTPIFPRTSGDWRPLKYHRRHIFPQLNHYGDKLS